MKSNFLFVPYKAAKTEVLALRKIAKTWQDEDGFWSFDTMVDTLSMPSCFLLYATEKKSADWMGAIIARSIFEFCEIVYIYVVPEKRKKGMGELFLKELVSFLGKENSVKEIWLEVKASNEKAQKLYERFGFKKTGIRQKYYSNGEDALIYKYDMK